MARDYLAWLGTLLGMAGDYLDWLGTIWLGCGLLGVARDWLRVSW